MSIVEDILALFSTSSWGEIPQLNALQVAKRLGISEDTARKTLTKLSRDQKKRPKQIYVCGWLFVVSGRKRHPRPVYRRGDHPDAKKPKEARRVCYERYMDRKKRGLVKSPIDKPKALS